MKSFRSVLVAIVWRERDAALAFVHGIDYYDCYSPKRLMRVRLGDGVFASDFGSYNGDMSQVTSALSLV